MFRFNSPLASGVRLIALIGIMMSASLLFGVLAWREAERARSTTEVLLTDYSEFVLEKLIRNIRLRFERLTGTWTSAVAPGPEPHFLTQDLVTALHAGSLDGVSVPSGLVDYFFLVLDGGRRIESLGPMPETDRQKLQRLAAGIPQGRCPAGGVVHISHFSDFLEADSGVDWAGVIRSDSQGWVDRILGFRISEQGAVEALFEPLLESADCCPADYLPASIADVPQLMQAASFSVRNASGAILYQSSPQYGSDYAATRQLDHELPLPGWSISATVNPALVKPLLPNSGEAFPWFVLAIPAFLMAGSLVLTVKALRRDAALYRMQHSFVAGVGHDLRTPLTRIRLFNELRSREELRDDGARDKSRRYGEIIDRESRRLTVLVENLLDFSRLQGGGSPSQGEVVDIGGVVEEAYDLFSAGQADGSRLRLEAAEGPRVAGDRQALFQLVVNLIDNALKYSPPDTVVRLGVSHSDERVSIEVEDRGCGIAPAEQKRVFDEFYRVDVPAVRDVTGSGIGLTLVRQTVDAHGGSIEIVSDGRCGTCIRVWLPAVVDRGDGNG